MTCFTVFEYAKIYILSTQDKSYWNGEIEKGAAKVCSSFFGLAAILSIANL